MRFEKPPATAAQTKLTDEQIIAANRWQDRKAKLEEERNGPINPEMRRRVIGLFAELQRDMATKLKNRPKERWAREPARMLTLEELAVDYATNPARLSEQAAEIMRPK